MKLKKQIVKRIFAIILIIAMVFPSPLGILIPWYQLQVYADEVRVTQKGGNLLDGQPFEFYGKHDRTGIWMWQDAQGHPLFCLQPTKAMQTGASMDVDKFSLDDDWDGELTYEQKELIAYAMMIAGCDENATNVSAAQYIMVQSAIWAVVSGEWTTPEDFKANIHVILSHVRNNQATVAAQVLGIVDEYVKQINDFAGDSKFVPWYGAKTEDQAKENTMIDQGNGVYSITFDNSVRNLKWIDPSTGENPVGWEITYDKTVDSTITFTCDTKKALTSRITLKGKGINSLATVGTPGLMGVLKPDKSNNQIMVGYLEQGPSWEVYASFKIPSINIEIEAGSFEIEYDRYEHEESFRSDYRIELEKKDAETGNPLANTTFDILEALDKSQLDGTGLDASQFRREPIELTPHVQLITDENGHLSHSDQKSYHYCKTYCNGHPDPVITYAEPIDAEGSSEEEQAAIDEANAEVEKMNEELEAAAWAEWQRLVDLCENECDFHFIESGEGEDALRDDRDATWSDFINLEYTYTAQEIVARNGYTLHDYHPDDVPVDIISMSSSQAGGEGHVVGTMNKGVPSISYSDGGRSHGSRDIEYEGSIEDSEVSYINQGSYDKDKIGFTFQIADHRTEGEIHFSKRDLELHEKDPDNSYAKSQGDATLEGAVYGLYAAADIQHPDGLSGKVFSAGELVAIAATDKNGDGSFMVITEESETSKLVPNLYNGSSLFGETYMDYATINGGSWIGRPLLMGSYFIEEITRSEGYELSIYGKEARETNRKMVNVGESLDTITSIESGLSHPINGWDGSWLDATVKYYNTRNGYDILISGYPQGSQFYSVTKDEVNISHEVEIRTEQPKIVDGSPVYQTAQGGEYKYDEFGNLIPAFDEFGEPIYDLSSPLREQIKVTNRLNYYPSGGAESEFPERYEEPADIDFVIEEINDLLTRNGYRVAEDSGPAWLVPVSGDTNEEMIDSIMDVLNADRFWDSYMLEDIYEVTTGAGTEEDPEVTQQYAVIRYGYTLFSNAENFYDEATDRVILKRSCEYDRDGNLYEGYCYVILPSGSFTKTGNRVVYDKFSIEQPVIFAQDPVLNLEYEQIYETYESGDTLLDLDGNPIPEMEIIITYETEDITEIQDVLSPLPNVTYDATTGNHIIHIENFTNWELITEPQYLTVRGIAPEEEIDGMPYADYILQKNGGGIDVVATRTVIDSQSYVVFQDLLYPGQLHNSQNGGTQEKPLIVLQRLIKQAVKVVKDISLNSYELRNTYSIHRDPFTSLHGGYNGKRPANALSGFYFKIYLTSDLLETGKLHIKADGSYDYKEFFDNEANADDFDNLAITWEDPTTDTDGDLTTIYANTKGYESFYGTSIMLPYGTYVIVEQQPTELMTKHYEKDDPKEVEVPLIPTVDSQGNTDYNYPDVEYYYDSTLTPEELSERYHIRFNTENHIIQANNRDGAFTVYKYGLSQLPQPYENQAIADYYHWESQAEVSGTRSSVYYDIYVDRDGNVIDYGVTKTDVPTMTGKSTAIDRKYAKALVPWTVLNPVQGGVIDDNGTIGNRNPGLDEGKFNFIAYNETGFENTFYGSRIRIEKLDSLTGENIIHDGAYFKIYAASRDVNGAGVNGVEGTGNVLFDADGNPVYDESEQIFLHDKDGNRQGIFKAHSTFEEVLTADGYKMVQKGYIELPSELGAGVYVLVEETAPEGYIRSKPIAFEVYSDKVTYYHNGEEGDRREAVQYQYAVALSEDTVTVSQFFVEDRPSNTAIYKVEDGINTVTYEVRGSKKLLEARGDVFDLEYDAIKNEWVGKVTKTYDEWSENIVYGTEAELKAMETVKLLYDANGIFLGKGIRFDISVTDAELTLYEGLEVQKIDGGYLGVTVQHGADGKVTEIIASETGTHTEINTHEKDNSPTKNDIYDSEEIKNPPVSLLFYDLETTPTERDPETRIIYILDERGNRTCMADPNTGMAYVIDDYGNIIVYPVDDAGEKIVQQSITIHTKEDGTKYIYTDVQTANDENGLPIYYENGKVILNDEIWNTDGEKHSILRLPFGAYVLEETRVPYDQGYIRTEPIGFILQYSDEEQKFFLEDDFTKIHLAKVDITTKEEIPDAHMTLYYAVRVEDDSERGWHLEIATDDNGEKLVRTSWISGYEYDDNGNPILKDGKMVPTTEPHWVDHIPVGDYIMEETIVPHHYGYVQSESVDVIVEETGVVQQFVMEDDYTSIEILKIDNNKDVVLPGATLGLSHAKLDENGQPVFDENSIPVVDAEAENSGHIFSWTTEDGKDVATTAYPVKDPDTGEPVHDPITGEPMIGYDYKIKPIPNTLRGHYYITETGATHLDYLPIGYYVLTEEVTPVGFATADPMLIEVKEIGGTVQIQKWTMEDVPLTEVISKANVPGGKQVAGAIMQIYDLDSTGNIKRVQAIDEEGNLLYETDENGGFVYDETGRKIPLMVYDPDTLRYEWETGKDGVYLEGDSIPEGFSIGDLKPHMIKYIPLGDYMLVEHSTPYGFLTSKEIPFTVIDTREIQYSEMIDEIPDGKVELLKYDEAKETLLEGASFLIRNKTLDKDIETIITDVNGKATSTLMPIGYMGNDGKFVPYEYTIQEVNAPEDYMLDPKVHEFQYQYVDGKTPIIVYELDATNMPNQVIVSKKTATGLDELPGAKLKVVNKLTQELIDEWVSTEQPHYIKGLKAGFYTLIELETPGEGFAIAPPMDFIITDNMVEVPVVTMIDDHTTVEVQKTASNTQEPLAGATLQVTRDSDGAVMDTRVTTEESYYLLGLEPGFYTLTELEAPKGYHIARPIKFEVKESQEIQVIHMIDQLITRPGGGITPPDTPNNPRPYISKEDLTDAKKLPGAWITIYNPDGSVYAKGKTDVNGRFYFNTPPAGTYKFQEIEAPDGYFINETIFQFVVDSQGRITGDNTIKDAKIPTVIISKKDVTDAKELPGAEIVITDEKGQVVVKDITDENGKIYFKPLRPGTYTFWETIAPDGYKINETVFKFVVHEDGSITGDHTIFDEPITGVINTNYNPDQDGSGIWDYIREGMSSITGLKPAKTGDSILPAIILFIILICSTFAICLFRKKGAKSKNNRNLFLFLLIPIIGAMLMLLTIPVLASETSETKTETQTYIAEDETQTYDFPDMMEDGKYTLSHVEYNVSEIPQETIAPETIMVPSKRFPSRLDAEASPPGDEYIDENGVIYHLLSTDIHTQALESTTEEVRSDILYQGIEASMSIPTTGQVQVTDRDTGNQFNKNFPLITYKLINGRWIDDFRLPITFSIADPAGSIYYLGETPIPYQEDTPNLNGHEAYLLQSAGLDAAEYQINAYAWTSQPYQGENSLFYRDAVATGSRYVVDCIATYGGSTELPGDTVYYYETTYSLAEPETTRYEITAVATYTPTVIAETVNQVPSEGESFSFLDFLTQPLTIGIGILILIGIIIAILSVLSKKKKESGKKSNHERSVDNA